MREVVEQPLSLQPLELLGQRNVRLQALPLTPEATSSATNANETLFRFAVVSDTHFWLPSTARAEWSRQSDALPERDGLLVSDSDAVVQQLLTDTAAAAVVALPPKLSKSWRDNECERANSPACAYSIGFWPSGQQARASASVATACNWVLHGSLLGKA